MKKVMFCVGLLTSGFVANISVAEAFSFTFEWGAIPRCTTGNPNTVGSPKFTLSAVPKGAATIKFHLRDNNAPDFNHGGGTAAYVGKPVIGSGAFKYQSPCPPDGSHTYLWTATVYDQSGKKLDSATSRKNYP